MNTTTYKRWMPPGRGLLAIFTLMFASIGIQAQDIDDLWVDWDEHELHLSLVCEDCGYGVDGVLHCEVDENPWDFVGSYADLLTERYFCESCGCCSESLNSYCYYENHCSLCGACVEPDDCCDGCYEEDDYRRCYDCIDDNYLWVTHCQYCNNHFEYDTSGRCDCPWSIVAWHCTDCSELQCAVCGGCLIVGGEETELADGGCMEHGICGDCLVNDLGEDGIHCPECHSCDQALCENCGLCEGCYMDQEHCPECDFCFGYGNQVDMCRSGGDHCIHCCEENMWLCEECGGCVEAEGQEFCDDCGLCEGCCMANSEDAGCTHGYCILSSEYDEHICPICQACPDDAECEFCGYCEDCVDDYHCEHGICPESDEWEEHLCTDCGDCFEPDEICEFCGKCESCRDHCEHGYCPEDEYEDGDHFICEQCGDCFEDMDRCEYCELCTECCNANTSAMGCDHDFCVESEDFAEHWCYTDDQCLELCNHDAECAHNNIAEGWGTDNNAHWKVCEDCGAAVSKAIHTEGNTETVSEPNSEQHRNGKANVYCAVCEQLMGTVSIPYIPVPEDGSPYIIDQPKDYEGKSNSYDPEGEYHYATFRVKAGGKDLKYQWYQGLVDLEYNEIIEDDAVRDGEKYTGSKTPTLKAFVEFDDCQPGKGHMYYCVISNDKGEVMSRIAVVKAQHVFKKYVDNGDGTHKLVCAGCGEEKWTKPHRYGEWTVTLATETTEGKREQACMDCNAANTIIIPKVEPGHEHAFDQLRYNSEVHWYDCRCGLSGKVATEDGHWPKWVEGWTDHWDETIIEATYTSEGKREFDCRTCGYHVVEVLPKLPHEHEWYTWNVSDGWDNYVWVRNNISEINPQRGGRSDVQHYVYCKTCGQMNAEAHDWNVWSEKTDPTPDKKGRLTQYCKICNQAKYTYYNYGTYPIGVLNGTAEPAAAAPGQTVTVTFNRTVCQNKYKFTKWQDQANYYNVHEGYGDFFKAVTFANANAETTTFVMPSGFVTIAADYDECNHQCGSTTVPRQEPTCRGYGHEAEQACAGCGKVMVPGARIAPLGHDLEDTPIEGTAVVEYCTVNSGNGNVPNPATLGYSGDFNCKRCGKVVKGKKTPLKHGWKSLVWGSTMQNWWTPLNPDLTVGNKPATCTTDGNTGDKYCQYCHNLGEKGTKIPRIGHEWGEWEIAREATTRVKGMEQRICQHDSSHVERRITDYSGPDYRLKADKTKLVFEYTYGDTDVEPQTVTFTSVGRNEITALRNVYGSKIGNVINLAWSGLKLTASLNLDNMEAIEAMASSGENEVLTLNFVDTPEGRVFRGKFTAPEITVTVRINKGDVGLKIAKKNMRIRPGRTFASPTVTSDVEGLPLKWTSSNSSAATVDATTGKVTPLAKGGTTTITATYEGDEHYKSAKVSYLLTVMGTDIYSGTLYQEAISKSTGEVTTSTTEDYYLLIRPSTDEYGLVYIKFDPFTLVGTRNQFKSFTVGAINAYDMDDSDASYYALSEPKSMRLGFRNGSLQANVSLTGMQSYPETPILKLVLDASNNEYNIYFAPVGTSLDTLKQWIDGVDDFITGVDDLERTEDGAIYDLQGRKLDKITQPGIYIKDGRKVMIK